MQRPQRDPNMAGLMSVVPGLGQLYNGENRKGLLFLCVGAINFIIFLSLMFNSAVLSAIAGFGQSFNIQPNVLLLGAMTSLNLGSPASLVLMGLFLAFMAYAMRDAYDHAARLHRKHIYADAIMEMPEATSGSYLFHVACMVTFLILAFFFLIPPPPKVQITDIEFIQNQQEVKRKIKSHRKAEKNSENRGKHNPNKPVRAPSPAPKKQSDPKPVAKPTPKPSPQPQKAPAPTPTPRPAPRPTPTPTRSPSPTPSPRPTPTPTKAPSPTPTPTPSAAPKLPFAMPNPFAKAPASPKAAPTPVPAPMAVGNVGTPAPAPRVASAISSGNPGLAPAPIASINTRGTSGGGGSHSPVPVMSGGGSEKGGGAGSPGPAPAPTRSSGGSGSGSGHSGPSLAVAPSVPRASGGGGGQGVEGNPDKGAKDGRPSLEAEKDVDFGPYMADLQRRIKRAWFPPKGNESKRVMVVFKVHRNGTMSNLRLQKSSGLAIADQAALKAIQNAAPFRTLPDGAPPDVDIQFTFDYNVFKGSGSGGLRRF